ncbi:methionine gamma-lyase [Proteus terrae]|uniref:L-methionine gamma-lyase n=1 Tax=Proteus terrae subsp. cibarius TaxID=626774 RepID=A0A6I6G0W0_9GAMM|nr:methionine gamma-lyase [Proteus terrae]MBG2915860.1 methionine gamma-lyase [Proteus terrae subsp. cibarius]MBG3090626.1 methionine gamma-lyase [Proteus terrae subsp. cibarius]MCO4179524.1 methionine gamma-lyase [Proteus terrae]MCO4188302.1 methionine gamma-lyase [Proteus terrae]QGW04241.1 methionine gamma-lyase [Proteus terrae subsp. cibarius]
MTQSNKHFNTQAIHYGYSPLDSQGALVPPVFQTSTFVFPTAQYGADCFSGKQKGHFYSRISNPTLELLEKRLAQLENGEGAVVFSSGIGAITSSCWSLLKPGDELIADMTVYGCTFTFFNHGLAKFGVKIKHVDLTNLEKLKEAITEKTKLIFFETPANPNMRVSDIAKISEIAHQHNILVMVDSTYCSPYLQQPLGLGADIVVHSMTKYLSGHGDVTAGAIITTHALADKIRVEGLKDMTGACLSPHDASLILRGIKTLGIRMEQICQNAQRIAQYLEDNPKVETIYYPGLVSFPQYELAKRQMRLAGGMIAIELKGGIKAGREFLNRLNLFSRAVSLGDCESLAQHPATMTHATYSAEERQRHGISDGLIRLSIGLEDVNDLIADLKQALA